MNDICIYNLLNRRILTFYRYINFEKIMKINVIIIFEHQSLQNASQIYFLIWFFQSQGIILLIYIIFLVIHQYSVWAFKTLLILVFMYLISRGSFSNSTTFIVFFTWILCSCNIIRKQLNYLPFFLSKFITDFISHSF